MRDSIHDNWGYAQAIDHERCRIVLHTVWPHCEPPEYTDIVFEQEKFGAGPYPANVLFDVEEADPLLILGRYADLLARTKNYGWPVLRYEGLEELVAQLSTGEARCFEVHGVCGVHGFVFAKTMELRPRAARAEVAG